MKVSVYYLLLFSSILFCNCFYSDQKISFHDRVVLGMNGVSTYLDYLKVENYKDGSFTAKQLCEIANRYIDTVKADKIIKGVIFLGQKNFYKLPEHMFNVSSERVGKLSILGFTFIEDKNVSKFKDVVHSMKLKTITLFKNGEHQTFYITNAEDKKIIDSVLASTEPYNNF